MKDRSAIWKARVASAAAPCPLDELYRGDHWTQSHRLLAAATAAGFEPRLWVASAGLGLRLSADSAPAYAATFSTRHADAVAASVEGNARWWGHLQERQGQTTLRELGERGPVLMVLSEVYAKAMEMELKALGAAGSESLLFGGGEEVPGVQRVASDAGLRLALGGTLTSLNARMAASWLKYCENGRLTSDAARSAWHEWALTVPRPEPLNRRPMADAEVIAFIRRETATQPSISRSRLLRRLRDTGRACEQSRFAELFKRTMGER